MKRKEKKEKKDKSNKVIQCLVWKNISCNGYMLSMSPRLVQTILLFSIQFRLFRSKGKERDNGDEIEKKRDRELR